jgi:hypothetical protein
MRCALLGSVALAASSLAITCGSSGSSDEEYADQLAEVQGAVAEAGFEVAQPFIDVSSCSTDEECVEAGDSLVAGLKSYNPTIESQISALESFEVPDEFTEFHDLYVEQLRLRVEAGDMIIEGWETADDDLLNDGFTRWQEAQAKLSEIVDELQSLQDQ